MEKIAIVLFNLGGPDKEDAVRPFLFNLFNDPAILRLPSFFRYLLAKLISTQRENKAKAIYAQIGGRSPILENTEKQARALEEAFGNRENIKCFVAMRYWHPFVDKAVSDVKIWGADKVVLLPLYPQFSTTTTETSLKSWHEAAQKVALNVVTKSICCYPENQGFIGSLADRLAKAYGSFEEKRRPRVLFSAHGLPEKIIDAGDPYAFQCQKSAEAIVKKLAIPNLDWVLCYQSRVGPLKWIGPPTESEIIRAGKDKVPLIIVAIAFVSEHSETLVEIDITYRALAEKAGVPRYVYLETVGIAASFILGLKDLVMKALESQTKIVSGEGGRYCPKEFKDCCQK